MPIIIGGSGGSGAMLPTLTNPADSGDILQGKQVINAGGKVLIGSIPSKASSILTPGAVGSFIGGGQYLSGNLTIPAEPNLTADNIRSGKSIFGVNGSFMGNVATGYFDIADTGVRTFTINGFGNFTPTIAVLFAERVKETAPIPPWRLIACGSYGGRCILFDPSWSASIGGVSTVNYIYGQNAVTIDLLNRNEGYAFAVARYHYLLVE